MFGVVSNTSGVITTLSPQHLEEFSKIIDQYNFPGTLAEKSLPTVTRDLLIAAEHLMKYGDYSTSVQILEKAISEEKHTMTYHKLIIALAKSGDFSKAKETVKLAIAFNPSDVEAVKLLHLESKVEAPQLSLKSQILKSVDSSPEKTEKKEEKKEIDTNPIENQEPTSSNSPDFSSKSLEEKVTLLLRENKVEDARSLCQNHIDSEPQDSEGFKQLGRIELEVSHLDEAVK